MTPPGQPRTLRLLYDEGVELPWLVQYCKTRPTIWVDITRFRHQHEADRYIADIRARDLSLLEAER